MKNEQYSPRDLKEADFGNRQFMEGYSNGYHEGLKEGFVKAKYPEICHCSVCHSHGEMCRVARGCESTDGVENKIRMEERERALMILHAKFMSTYNKKVMDALEECQKEIMK